MRRIKTTHSLSVAAGEYEGFWKPTICPSDHERLEFIIQESMLGPCRHDQIGRLLGGA